MAGDKNKHTIWVLLFSLLAFTTTFQQNYHNNQVAVTPNEMVGLYCCDQPLNYLPIFLSGFSLVLGSSKERQFTWCQDLPSTRVFLPVSQEDPSSRNKYNPLHVNRIQQTYGAWMIRLLGSSSLHVNRSPLFNLSTDPPPPPPPLPRPLSRLPCGRILPDCLQCSLQKPFHSWELCTLAFQEDTRLRFGDLVLIYTSLLFLFIVQLAVDSMIAMVGK